MAVETERRYKYAETFGLSQFTLNEKMYIENANIQNCKISEIQNRICVISKCNFYNVVFENSFYEVYATFKECKFIKCMFRDTFEGEDLELLVKDNIFIDCVFENISYRSFQVQSNVTYSKFVNCNFSNIKMEEIILYGIGISRWKNRQF